MKQILLILVAGVIAVSAAQAGNISVGDQIQVQRGFLLFEDRHKQEELAVGATVDKIKSAIEDGDCIMVKRPVEAVVIAEVGQEIQIQQDGGMTWWTTKSAVTR